MPSKKNLALALRTAKAAVPAKAPHRIAVPADAKVLSEEDRAVVAGILAAMRDAKQTGDEIRSYFAGKDVPATAGVTGGLRRSLLREFALDGGRIARSYDVHRDGETPRTGTPRAAVPGSKAAADLAARRAEEAAAAKAASKRKSAARKSAATRAARKSA
jgi:hypothetical protein